MNLVACSSASDHKHHHRRASPMTYLGCYDLLTSSCLPNEDEIGTNDLLYWFWMSYSRSVAHFRMPFRITYQGCEYVEKCLEKAFWNVGSAFQNLRLGEHTVLHPHNNSHAFVLITTHFQSFSSAMSISGLLRRSTRKTLRVLWATNWATNWATKWATKWTLRQIAAAEHPTKKRLFFFGVFAFYLF